MILNLCLMWRCHRWGIAFERVYIVRFDVLHVVSSKLLTKLSQHLLAGKTVLNYLQICTEILTKLYAH
jgi:hypothetical protein